MRTTQQFSITLSNTLADAVKSRVATGEYASESEVIRDGLRASRLNTNAQRNGLDGLYGRLHAGGGGGFGVTFLPYRR